MAVLHTEKRRVISLPVIISGILLSVIVIGGIVFLTFFMSTHQQTGAKPTLPPFPSAPLIADELVIKYREGQAPQNLSENQKKELENSLANLGVISSQAIFEKAGPPFNRYFLVKLKPGTNLEKATKKIYQLDQVEFVGPNTVYETL